MHNHPSSTPPPSSVEPRTYRLGLPLIAVIGLALLAAPRVVLHDLGLIHEGTGINALFVFVPPLVWIAVTLAARVHNPFITLLSIGICYGVFLAVGHQVLWNISFASGSPQLGGNLAELDPALQSLVFRAFSSLSSLITGTVIGAVAGGVTWGITALARKAPRGRGK